MPETFSTKVGYKQAYRLGIFYFASMPAANDYLLDENSDLLFVNGDLAVGESDAQHIQDTINADIGWWKEYPTDGVGIRAYLGSNDKAQALEKKARENLAIDGYAFVRPPEAVYEGRTLTLYANAYRP